MRCIFYFIFVHFAMNIRPVKKCCPQYLYAGRRHRLPVQFSSSLFTIVSQ